MTLTELRPQRVPTALKVAVSTERAATIVGLTDLIEPPRDRATTPRPALRALPQRFAGPVARAEADRGTNGDDAA